MVRAANCEGWPSVVFVRPLWKEWRGWPAGPTCACPIHRGLWAGTRMVNHLAMARRRREIYVVKSDMLSPGAGDELSGSPERFPAREALSRCSRCGSADPAPLRRRRLASAKHESRVVEGDWPTTSLTAGGEYLSVVYEN